MATKFLSFALIAAVVSQGYAVTQINLDDQSVSFISNPIYGQGIAIPKSRLDTLVTCYVTFPNNVMFEVYPNSNIQNDFIFPAIGNAPFNQCGIEFRNAGLNVAGTYQLMSLIEHSDGTSTLLTKNFHVTIQLSEVEFPN